MLHCRCFAQDACFASRSGLRSRGRLRGLGAYVGIDEGLFLLSFSVPSLPSSTPFLSFPSLPLPSLKRQRAGVARVASSCNAFAIATSSSYVMSRVSIQGQGRIPNSLIQVRVRTSQPSQVLQNTLPFNVLYCSTACILFSCVYE